MSARVTTRKLALWLPTGVGMVLRVVIAAWCLHAGSDISHCRRKGKATTSPVTMQTSRRQHESWLLTSQGTARGWCGPQQQSAAAPQRWNR